MYPSDYGYAAGNNCVIGTGPYNYDGGCMNKDWLYISNTAQWLISSRSSYDYSVFYVDIDGHVSHSYSKVAFAVHPVFYLSSSASISEGEGTLNAPYILS